ncbi:MAG TPA: hypothetical protein VKN18_31440 [Blastocatellia bacterium]|nr:hypothetical protein [Blastocatellia bacterium]
MSSTFSGWSKNKHRSSGERFCSSNRESPITRSCIVVVGGDDHEALHFNETQILERKQIISPHNPLLCDSDELGKEAYRSAQATQYVVVD